MLPFRVTRNLQPRRLRQSHALLDLHVPCFSLLQFPMAPLPIGSRRAWIVLSPPSHQPRIASHANYGSRIAKCFVCHTSAKSPAKSNHCHTSKSAISQVLCLPHIQDPPGASVQPKGGPLVLALAANGKRRTAKCRLGEISSPRHWREAARANGKQERGRTSRRKARETCGRGPIR